MLHDTQVVRHAEGRPRAGAQLVHGDALGVLEQQQTLTGQHLEHRQLRYDPINHAAAREGKRALFQDLGLAVFVHVSGVHDDLGRGG